MGSPGAGRPWGSSDAPGRPISQKKQGSPRMGAPGGGAGRRIPALSVSWGCSVLLACLALAAPGPAAGGTYYPDETVYHTVARFNEDVKGLAEQHSSCVTLEVAGKSGNGENLHLIRMTDPDVKELPGGKKKVVILITFGEHAREFLPVESFFKLVRQLAFQFEQGDRKAAFILGHVELLLVGLVNPDGRRRLENKKDFCWRGMANGVDVNRNFPWEYGGPGSSGDPKNEEYRGTGAMSEPESKAMAKIAEDNKIDAFLSMHTGVQYIFTPYSDSVSKRTMRRHPTTDTQLLLADAMWAASGGFFMGTGIVNEMNDYAADGTMADYFAGVLNVPYSLTFELYGKIGDLPNCFEQFNPDNTDLEETLTKMHPMYDAAFLHLIEARLSIADPFKHPAVAAGSDWVFYRGMDSEGSDLVKVNLSPLVQRRVFQLKDMCNLLPECAGFTTSGWLKKAIAPSNKLVAWSGGSEEGLYVKVVTTVDDLGEAAKVEALVAAPGAGKAAVPAGPMERGGDPPLVVAQEGAWAAARRAGAPQAAVNPAMPSGPSGGTEGGGAVLRAMGRLDAAQEAILRIKSRAEVLQAEINNVMQRYSGPLHAVK